MDILEALSIFSLNDLSSISKADIKKKFKVLMRKHHPDLGGDEEKAKEINGAYGIILNNISLLEMYSNTKKEEVFCIIPFNKLSDIYNGENITLKNEGKDWILKQSNLRTNKVVLMINLRLLYKGNILEFEKMSFLNNKDDYYIDCKLYDTAIDVKESIKIFAYGKEYTTDISGRRLDKTLYFDNSVNLHIRIERVERNG